MQHRIVGLLSGKYAKFVTDANLIVGYTLERSPVASTMAVIGSNLSAYEFNVSAYYSK
jgi:hypothetical protein